MTLVEAGPDYCRKHSGIREEDQDYCDFADRCDSCHGNGETYDKAGDVTGICEDCDGSGVETCDLTPLLYENGVDT